MRRLFWWSVVPLWTAAVTMGGVREGLRGLSDGELWALGIVVLVAGWVLTRAVPWLVRRFWLSGVRVNIKETPYLVDVGRRTLLVIPDTIFTNKSHAQPASVAVRLRLHGHPMDAVNLPVEQWRALQREASVPMHPQLTFPLNLPPHESVGGCVLFREDDHAPGALEAMQARVYVGRRGRRAESVQNTTDNDQAELEVTDLTRNRTRVIPLVLRGLTWNRPAKQ